MDRSIQTYAFAWIDPDHKLSTRVNSQDGTNLTWNDKPSSRPKGILNIGAAIIDNSMQSKPLGYNHNNLIKPSHPAMLELHHTKSDSSSMLSSEAIAPKHQAKAKKGKTSSQITRSRSPLFCRDQDFSIEFG
ncbi:hypothetical protein JHK87_027946 [Glycine soja]|nr:hypothetical protein JHK87_027946 [Glycine soja]